MGTKVKNVLMAIVCVIVIIVLARLAWTLAGVLIKVILSAGILLVLIGAVWYFYNQFRRR